MRFSTLTLQNILFFVFVIVTLSFSILVNIPSSYSQETNRDSTGCNCVVFRFDDIQDYFLNKSQIAVMDLFLKNDQTLSLALILNYLGNDSSIINKVLSGYEAGNFELDSHGWNHENFSTFSELNQVELLKKANQRMYDLFKVKSSIFVPPFFAFDNSTMDAMDDVGMTIISSYDRLYVQRNQSYLITNLAHPDIGDKNKIIHFPNTVEYSYFDGKKWNTHPIEQVLGEVDRSLEGYGYAVITLHPQAFVTVENGEMVNSLNDTQINTLERLLESMKSRNVETTDFYKLNQIRLEEESD